MFNSLTNRNVLTSRNAVFSLRNVENVDLDQVLYIQETSYPSYLLEDRNAYTGYLNKFSQGCIALFENTNMVAYCFSYPYYRNHSITYPEGEIPFTASPDCYYLHDIAIDPKYRGQGLSSIMFDAIEGIAIKHGFKIISLTSVNNRRKYWEQYGFKFFREIHHDGKHVADLMEKSIQISSKI